MGESLIIEENLVFDDYPTNKYAKKIDWWTSDKGIDLIAGWRRAGYTIKQICAKIGVDIRSLNAWRKKCPDLADAIDIGKDIADTRVENALFKRAVGFYYDEVTKELIEGELRTTKVVTKYVVPDTKAALHYLYNRKWQDWRAIQQPIDVDANAIENADDILVAIRSLANTQGTRPDTSPSPSGNDEGQEAVNGPEGQGSATENAGSDIR